MILSFHLIRCRYSRLGKLCFLLLCSDIPSSSSAQSLPASSAHLEITVRDLSPKFLTFYTTAQKEHASLDRRWVLWKQLYDFAAVPPTPAGDTIARRLLNAAWPRYESVLSQLEKGAVAMQPAPQETLRAIAALLQPDKPVHLVVLAYVGGFEGNAFTNAEPGKITVALPMEVSSQERASLMAHEFTHGVHISMGSIRGGYIRTIGTIVVSEGLACRVRQRLFPQQPPAQSIEYTPGWLANAEKHKRAILQGIKPLLSSQNPAEIMRFTMGKGSAGLEREAYYVGWLVVEYWLAHQLSFADIARIPEAEMPRQVADAIDHLLALRSAK